MHITPASLPLLGVAALALQGSASASPIEDPTSPYRFIARQQAASNSTTTATNTSTAYDPTAALASLPRVVSTFDGNSSTTGIYTSLNDTYLPAINASSQGLPYEHPVSGTGGAVTTEVDVCSNVGADLLSRGGSAADAVSCPSFSSF